MKFGQSIKYKIRNIYLEKSYKKSGEEASPRPFYNKLRCCLSLVLQSEMLENLFVLYIQVEVY